MIYFGTDGIRGEVSNIFTPDKLFKISFAIADVLKEEGIKKICIGQDTRISSNYISSMIISILLSKGIDVENLGEVSTPVVSFAILKDSNINIGIMISASHNPYQDNGIKIFGHDGKKVSENFEKKIENKINTSDKEQQIIDIGRVYKNEEIIKSYIKYVQNIGSSLKGKVIALDLANGCATAIAPKIFEYLGASIITVGDISNGYNINQNVGSTHVKTLSEFIKSSKEKIDFGFSYDGDADRVLLLNSRGDILDGDYIIYILAKYLKENGKLKNQKVVLTVMANLGLKKALKKLDIQYEECQVGDKYVMQMLHDKNLNLGGEQSGHIIISDLLPTGDGILTSVFLAKIITKMNINLEDLIKEVVKFPQKIINLQVEDKKHIMDNKQLLEFIDDLNNQMEDGRILVRASGTEEKIRIMVESKKNDTCNKICDIIVNEIKKQIN